METINMEKIMGKLEEIKQATLLGSKKMLTVEECATYINMTKETLYQKVYNREIPHYKRGKLYFDKNEIDEWLKTTKRPTKDEIDSQAATYVTLKKTKTT